MCLMRAYLLSMAVTAIGLPLCLWVPTLIPSGPPPPASHVLLGDVHVSEQLAPVDMSRLRSRGFQTIIDLRPDGEVANQTPSEDMRRTAGYEGLAFAYIPTPHGSIPDTVVDELSRTLASARKPVMLYCRSGNRAARAWALAEASRSGGPDATTIRTAVRAAGQKVDDISAAIEARIAARKPIP